MVKQGKKRLLPSSCGEPSTSTNNPSASQDALTRSSKVTSTNSADSVPTSSSNDPVGDKSAAAPAVDTLLRRAPGKHTQIYEGPSASSSRSAEPASSKKPGRPLKLPVFKNAAGTSCKPTGATKSQPAARKTAASFATARGPTSAASRQESRGHTATAQERRAPHVPSSSSCKPSESGLTARPMKRRACSDHSGHSVANLLRPAESSSAPLCSVPTNGAMALQGVQAPVVGFSGELKYPPPQWGFPLMQVPVQSFGGPSQPEVPRASDPPIEDAEMEDLSDVIDENLQNQVPLADQKGTFVITDTNIFLYNLGLVERLTALDSGPPDVKVCIPWMAIQELDHIKNRKRGLATRRAVEAIAYINKALVTKNPKFRGQTIAEARTKDDCVPQNFHNNDDHFIHCCIVVMNTGNRVLLLSNDVNLRNKALINDIQSFSAAELEAILDLEFGRTPVLAQPRSSNAKEPAAAKVVSAAPVLQTKGVACVEVREILRRSLNMVLESELQSAFGDLWPRVVAFKPPWTEETALQCILKHWIALTGMAFKSSLKKVVENLLSALRMQRLDSSRAGSVLWLSLELCSELQVHYYLLAGDVARLRELHEALRSRPDKCSGKALDMAGGGATAAQPGPSSGPGVSSLDKVIALCDDVWHVLNDYCGPLAVRRGVQYRYPFEGGRGFRYDARTQLEALKHVTYVLEQFEHLLKAPYDKRKTMVVNTSFCLNSIKRLVEILNYEGREPIRGADTTPEEMALCFADPAHDVQLRRGVGHLCYMHQCMGDSSIGAIGPKPATSAKK